MALPNKRILIADDLVTIHEDFQKILATPGPSLATVPGLASFAPQLVAEEPARPHYELNFVTQGDDALRSVSQAEAAGRPFAAVFLDVRMPPGIDGVETAERLLAAHPQLPIALCTAYTDYSFAAISGRFAAFPNFVILKKPFDPAEVLQVAHILTDRWNILARLNRLTAALHAAAPALQDLAGSRPEVRALLREGEGA